MKIIEKNEKDKYSNTSRQHYDEDIPPSLGTHAALYPTTIMSIFYEFMYACCILPKQ